MKNLKRWVHDIFSEPDNNTICPIRILAFVGFLYALIVHGYSIFILKAIFDLTAFGTTYGVMLASLGAALMIKTDSKGKQDETTTN